MRPNTRTVALVCAGLLSAGVVSSGLYAKDKDQAKGSPDWITKEVHHELVMLPYYNVFDDLSYRVDGSTVTLFGGVTNPALKSDAENVVKKIEGVTRVNNQIEVLPLSPNDEQIRRAVFRAIYRSNGLERYALNAIPPIHIIVKNGNVTLVGAVGNEMDKNLAGMAAKQVPGTFSVTNNLVVSKE